MGHVDAGDYLGQEGSILLAQQGVRSVRESKEGITGKLCHRYKNLKLSVSFLIETLCIAL